MAAPSQPAEVIVVSGCSRDHAVLRNCLRGSAWAVFPANNVESALELAQTLTHPIIICSDELDRGKWKDLLDAANSLEASPPFILATATIDGPTWAEALHLGAHDVVAKPFEVEEVLHVVRTAYLRSRDFAHTVAAAG